ncbi:MATE family efflux transporter [Salinivibrio sp. DV]|uniref:MATE family efflux transporter n=1 Tax=Salinivibrio sp. SS2 TaxID=1892894 RepID=UPI0020C7DEE3|nr:MATE family efflux transporter [Salinivibrio sp. DV]
MEIGYDIYHHTLTHCPLMPAQLHSLSRQFWRYTLPTVAAMLVNGLYQVIDGIFIGHVMGADGLAGINLIWPLIAGMLGIGLMIGVGAGAKISAARGKGHDPSGHHTLAVAIGLVLLLSVFLSFALVAWGEYLLALQGAEQVPLAFAVQYLDVLVWANVFTLGSMAVPILLRNDDQPGLATRLMMLGALLNIGFDLVFIVWLEWTLTGAAIATALAQAAVTLVGVSYFFSRRSRLQVIWPSWSQAWSITRHICAIGAASWIMYGYSAVMVAVHNHLLMLHGGKLAVGAYAVIGYVVIVYYLLAEGVANGMQPLVSFYAGASQPHWIKRCLLMALCCVLVTGVAFVAVINGLPNTLARVFVGSGNPALLDSTVNGLRLHLILLFLDGFIVVAAAYFQAIHHGRTALMISIGNIVLQLPFLFLFASYWQLDGVWLAYPASNLALAIPVGAWLAIDLRRRLRHLSPTDANVGDFC